MDIQTCDLPKAEVSNTIFPDCLQRSDIAKKQIIIPASIQQAQFMASSALRVAHPSRSGLGRQKGVHGKVLLLDEIGLGLVSFKKTLAIEVALERCTFDIGKGTISKSCFDMLLSCVLVSDLIFKKSISTFNRANSKGGLHTSSPPSISRSRTDVARRFKLYQHYPARFRFYVSSTRSIHCVPRRGIYADRIHRDYWPETHVPWRSSPDDHLNRY